MWSAKISWQWFKMLIIFSKAKFYQVEESRETILRGNLTEKCSQLINLMTFS
jgi:hypothetical protein